MSLLEKIKNFFFPPAKAVDTSVLDKACDELLNEFDQEHRFKDMTELSYPKRELKTALTYAISVLWAKLVNSSEDIYKRIQDIESQYIKAKADLDDKIDFDLKNKLQKRQEIVQDIEEIDEEIKNYDKQKKEIEHQFNTLGDDKNLKGSLNKIPGWLFWIVMLIAGAAEMAIYKSVFLSQEIGLKSERPLEEQIWVDVAAYGMSVGFILMLIWLSHKMGEILRHLDTMPKHERKFQWLKFGFIAVTVGVAIWATVNIRTQMYDILGEDQKVQQLKDSEGGDGVESLLGDTDEDEEDSMGEDEEEDSMGDEEDALEDEGQATQKTLSKKQQEIEEIRTSVNEKKAKTSFMFVFINIFIVVGGVFLSYETHTSSREYETIERLIRELRREKRKLEKKLKSLDREIMRFKNNHINTRFKEMLQKAAAYDKEIRVYDAYIYIFEFKMQLIENYLKSAYEQRGVEYGDISYKDLLKGKIELDYRKELYHVKNIDEYLIYRDETNQGVQNDV